MNYPIRLAAALAIGTFAPAKVLAAPNSPLFVGNEAVYTERDTQKVDLPPLTAAAQRFVRAGGKGTKPFGQSEVYVIETQAGAVECSLPYFSAAACGPLTLGQVKRPRFWTVRLSGVWVHCTSRAPDRKCEPANAGVPGAMSAVE